MKTVPIALGKKDFSRRSKDSVPSPTRKDDDLDITYHSPPENLATLFGIRYTEPSNDELSGGLSVDQRRALEEVDKLSALATPRNCRRYTCISDLVTSWRLSRDNEGDQRHI